MDHETERAAVVKEAREWIGTPYHNHARLKGIGCDCLTFVVEVYERTKTIPPYNIPHYNPSFHLHHSEELYLTGVLAYCNEIEEAAVQPGDLVLFKFGRVYSHGALVIAWPNVAHAFLQRPVVIDDVERSKWLSTVGELAIGEYGKRRKMKFFSPKVWR
jgi:NlpC/P60 family putative phage cell wall peptidase